MLLLYHEERAINNILTRRRDKALTFLKNTETLVVIILGYPNDIVQKNLAIDRNGITNLSH